MKIEIKIDDESKMILSDDSLNNENYIEMWFENYEKDSEGEYVKKSYFPEIESLLVPIDELLRALSALYKIKNNEHYIDGCEME